MKPRKFTVRLPIFTGIIIIKLYSYHLLIFARWLMGRSAVYYDKGTTSWNARIVKHEVRESSTRTSDTKSVFLMWRIGHLPRIDYLVQRGSPHVITDSAGDCTRE